MLEYPTYNARVVVVDSGSTDNTIGLAKQLGAEVYSNPWPGFANQVNWALANCNINTPWVIRLDADEYLDNRLVAELADLSRQPDQITGINVRRKIIFMNKFIRWGGVYPFWLLRIWRHTAGRCEVRSMDEHIVLNHGETASFKGHIIDHSMKGIDWWVTKHIRYASSEAQDLSVSAPLDPDFLHSQKLKTRLVRLLKVNLYNKCPLGWRAAAYFFYRFVFRLGFLDGAPGYYWHLFQGLWYRSLVDIKVREQEMKKRG